MKLNLNNKEIKSILVNENTKTVTVVSEDSLAASLNGLNKIISLMEGTEPELKDTKVVTMSKVVKGDEFDKYVGVALSLAYNIFGSKTQFHKFVDNDSLVKQVEKKDKKTKKNK